MTKFNETVRYKTPRSLMRKSMMRFVVCIAALFVLAAPAFYLLTKNYYAEDMADLIDAVQAGKDIPMMDLEEDIMKGIMLQYLLITALLFIGIMLTIRLMSKKLWQPFDKTLRIVESFKLENMKVPFLPKSDVKEFERLTDALHKLMKKDIETYVAQKEFTENASHELQTPLAIFQTKLELLSQQPELTAEQANIIQDLFQMTSRLSHLNRSLLLLAKIDNRQFDTMERIQLEQFVDSLLPSLESISGQLHIYRQYSKKPLRINANRILLESMVNNLFINAVRHNTPDGTITVSIDDNRLTISNTSAEPPLSPSLIFRRFYRPTQNKSGNGLGLAIVKAICDYHGWTIEYQYTGNQHCFVVSFG